MCVYAGMCVSELVMMELTPPEDSDLAIDLWAIYTPFLSEAISTSATQSARGVIVYVPVVGRR